MIEEQKFMEEEQKKKESIQNHRHKRVKTEQDNLQKHL